MFCCVGNDNDLREVTLGPEGAFNAVRKGAVFIDNTTASANVARELYAAARSKGFDFLDAPVSGGQAGAQNGVLTVMVGGDQAVFDRAKPVIDHYARMVNLIGPAGAGQLTKMVNQICIAGLVQALSEGIHFAQKAGLDLQKALHQDIKKRRKAFPMIRRGPDPNIDQRRVGTLLPYFKKHWEQHTAKLDDPSDPLRPGDIILMDTFPSRHGPDHIGILSDRLNADGLPLVINNWTNGTVTSEMDLLPSVPVLYRFRSPP